MTKAGPPAKRGCGVSPIYLDEDHQPEQSSVIDLRGRRRRRIVFGWYGGKFSHLDWLLPLLPQCHHYCEAFAGSGAVLINRDPAPVETYNDIDGTVVNFFRVLRDRHEELIRAIALTPFSREEYHGAIYGSTNGISDVERARRFYIKARQRPAPDLPKPRPLAVGRTARIPAGQACLVSFRVGLVAWKH